MMDVLCVGVYAVILCLVNVFKSAQDPASLGYGERPEKQNCNC
jgi:hypothetical protein